MKALFLPLALFFITSATAQSDSAVTKFVKDTLYTQSGYKVYEKQMLKIGTGTMPDGDFKYIRIASTSLFQYQGTDRQGIKYLLNRQAFLMILNTFLD